jgi:hypothetical protein
MRALLWKDYRMNRALLIVSAVALVGPYLIGAAVQWRDAQSTGMWGGTIAASAIAAMATSLLTISLLAANAFTQERTDRSAEFLAGLPPSRRSILLSKFVLAFSVSVGLWMVNLFMGLVVAPRLGQFQPGIGEPIDFLLPTSVLVFGAGWAASTLMSSPVGAWGIASASPMVVGGMLFLCYYLFGAPSEEQVGRVYLVVSYALGGATLLVSSVVYVRRVEP